MESKNFHCLECPVAWKLELGGQPFGTVRRPGIVSRDSLKVRLSDGHLLPREDRLGDFAAAIWRILSLKFLYSAPPPNRDRVIPEGVGSNLSEKELMFYFAVNLLFRAWIFQIDFRDS